MSTVDTTERLPVAGRAEVRRAIARLVAADRGRAALVLILYTLAAAAGVALPLLLGEVVDGIGSGWSVERINTVCAVILVCVVAQFVLSRLCRRSGYQFGERAAARLRESVIGQVLTMQLGQVERAGTGDLGTRTSSDVNAAANLLRDNGPTMVTALIEVAVLYAAMFVVHPVLGVCALAVVPALILLTRRYLLQARPAFLDQRAAMSEVAETLSASGIGAKTVEAFALQFERREAGYRRAEALHARVIDVLRIQSWFFPALQIINRGQLLLIVTVGGLWYLEEGLSLGSAVAAITLAIRVSSPSNTIMMQLNEFQQGAAALARIEGVGLIGAEDRSAVPHGADIRLEGVTFGYGNGPDVLHGLSMHPRMGERLVVVGPSGAGKSTIARLLAGIDRPRTGTATLGGVPIADIMVEELRRRVVLVTQEYYVFTATLRDNLILGEPETSDDQLLDALQRVDARWVGALPAGLDTMLGDEHRGLSVAEAQQLALARVIISDPDVVILDEATAGIDPASAGNVEAALASALSGRTVIAIAHQLQAAQAADRIAVVEDGRIAELGTHEDLLGHGGSYAKLWRAWKGPKIR